MLTGIYNLVKFYLSTSINKNANNYDNQIAEKRKMLSTLALHPSILENDNRKNTLVFDKYTHINEYNINTNPLKLKEKIKSIENGFCEMIDDIYGILIY